MLAQSNTKRNTWAIVHMMGSYRAVTSEQATRERNLYGYEILHTGLTAYDANQWLETYRSGVVVDLSDALIWDTEIEETDAIQEYDTVTVRCHDDIYRTGQVITWNDDIVVIEVGSTLHFAYAESAELIAKLEWESEYESWLDENYAFPAPQLVGDAA